MKNKSVKIMKKKTTQNTSQIHRRKIRKPRDTISPKINKLEQRMYTTYITMCLVVINVISYIYIYQLLTN